MSSKKAPSAGTKVTTGEDIPVAREAPGNVAQSSLAAESASRGGAFAANPGMEHGPPKQQQQPQPQPQPQQQQQSQAGEGISGSTAAANKTTSLSLENQQAYGGAAPSYVANQRIRDPAGPHGKNLTEGGFEGSGTEGGPLPEPGSIEDPARVATRDLKAGMASRGRDAGPRQTTRGGGVGEGHWYDKLGSDEPA